MSQKLRTGKIMHMLPTPMCLSNTEMKIPITHRVVECLLLIIKLYLIQPTFTSVYYLLDIGLCARDTVVNKMVIVPALMVFII